MKHLSFTTVLHIFCSSFLIAQGTTSPFICLSRSTFTIPDLVLKAGLECTVVANISVVDLEQTVNSVKLLGSDSSDVPSLFKECTVENIRQLTFLHDTTSADIRITYKLISSRELSSPYTMLESESSILAVFPRPSFMSIDRIGTRVRGDTVIMFHYLPVSTQIHGASDIVVQRTFEENAEGIRILRSNYPELTDSILAKARQYQRSDFLQVSATSTIYIIRFYLFRNMPECYINRVY